MAHSLQIKYTFLILLLQLSNVFVVSQNLFVPLSDNKLADGNSFVSWEKPFKFTRTYHVAQKNTISSDANDGSEKYPFKSISKAAQLLQPGERVVIHTGLYRESVNPAFGGTSPDKFISYEAAEGDSVIIAGSIELPSVLFVKSSGWIFTKKTEDPSNENLDRTSDSLNVWQINLQPEWFDGYNPFGMLNLLNDTEWLDYQKADMTAHFKRRGLLFVDGKFCDQISKPSDIAASPDFSFWIEHNGMRLHLKLPKGKTPSNYLIEATNKEQVFSPKEYGFGYIRLKGITFRHAGNGFPVPQRGLVSTSRGHHWIVEDCTIEWANSVGIDMGNESWSTPLQPIIARHIVRRNIIQNCGISGLQCYIAKGMLVEDNLISNIGFHSAEHAFESGGIKFHQAQNCLIRRNVFSKISHAPGLWLDYNSNKNCRITSNLFSEITSARGGIYIEVSKNNCLVDHNVFYKMRCQSWLNGEYGAGGSAFYTDGSDSINFVDNLIIDAENTGYGAYLNAERIVGMRGGITCDHRVEGNIFIDCKKHAIEFANSRNFSDRNLYLNSNPAYIKICNPAPALLLDMYATMKLYGWDKSSMVSKIKYEFDIEKFTCKFAVENGKLEKYNPFIFKLGINSLNVDPRNLKINR